MALLASACASRNVPPIGASGRPFRPEADERALWAKAEKEEEALLKRARVYDDPELEKYLTALVDRLLPDGVRTAGVTGVKVEVIRDATLNAFAMPNGRIYIHTGLLSRVGNEAQLATVIGHELAHFTNRHALKVTRAGGNKELPHTTSATAARIGVAAAAGSRVRPGESAGTAVLSPTANAVRGLGLGLVTLAAISGYGSDLEQEADRESLERLVHAGYDPREAPKVFQLFKSEVGERGAVETFFFGSQEKLQERFDTTTLVVRTVHAAAASESGRIRNTDDFDVRLRTVVRENAHEDIRLGRFVLAEKQLDRVLKLTPDDPVTHLYYGDLHRLQAQRAKSLAEANVEASKALERYEKVTELDPKLPDPYRQLGFLFYQQKDTVRAREAFQKYLELKPDAPDAQRIKEYLTR